MSVWEIYWALLVVVVVGWLFGVGYRRLTEEAHWTQLKADLKSTTARAKSLEIAAKGAAAELDEVRGKFEALEREKARLAVEAERVPELARAAAELREELSRTQEARAAAEARVEVASGAAKAAELEQENLRRRLEAFQAETTRLRTETERLGPLEGGLAELRAEQARTQQELATAAARATAAEAAAKTAETELSRLRSQVESAEVEKGRLRSEAARLPTLEQTLSELRDELTKAQNEQLGAERNAEQLEDVRASLEFARSKLAAYSEEKSRLESTVALVPGLQETVAKQQAQLEQLRTALAQADAENARLAARVEAVAASAEERQAVIEEARTTYAEAFRALSAEAIESSRAAFLDVARAAFDQLQRHVSGELEARENAIESRLSPIAEVVARLQSVARELEINRLENRAALSDDVEALRHAHEALRAATSQLGPAPRAASPGQRATAAPIPLQRLLEMTGLSERCSFEAPASVLDGKESGPELLLHLSGGRTTAIDSRVPLDAYLASLRVDDGASRQELLRRHAAQMQRHVERLAPQAGRPTADTDGFVIMYVPVEDALAAALEVDPELVYRAVGSSVIPAGPVTLLTHLRTAAWTAEAAKRQQRGDV